MTDLSEVLSALKRDALIIDEIQHEFNDSIKTTTKGLEDIKEPIQELIDFEKRQNDEISHYESKNLSLSQEINSLKEEKLNHERLLKETQDLLTSNTEKRTKLESNKRDISSELIAFETKLQNAKNDLSLEKEQNERLLAEISQIVESTEEKIHALEQQVEAKRDAIRKIKGERMALEYLIKHDHIEFNEIKIIQSLDGRKNTDLATISKVTGLSNNLIEKTLEGLMKRNLLTYDNSSGIITITGSLKL
ncbi:MAG: hypothetical protein FK734_08785 [Asgard group archaeon]|nr:hypothetical protein [Asgard group archaeon]